MPKHLTDINAELKSYYDNLKDEDPSQRVGWKNKKAQINRFNQFLKLFTTNNFSVNDFGCGHGHFFDFLIEEKPNSVAYFGYDMFGDMLPKTRQFNVNNHNAHFFHIGNYSEIKMADYSIASGIFNLKFNLSEDKWLSYILNTITSMNQNSKKGFAFNALTKYSDQDKMQDHIYYADPLFFFDYCKRNFSTNVALLHDYEEYDFTIIVRK